MDVSHVSTVVLAGVEDYALQFLAALLMILAMAIGKRVFSWLGVKMDVDQKAELQDAANKSMAFAISSIESKIKDKGWDHPDVKNAAVSAALSYMVEKFQDTLKRSGVTPEKAAYALFGLMSRTFAPVATQMAASPATPAAPSPPVVVLSSDAPIDVKATNATIAAAPTIK